MLSLKSVRLVAHIRIEELEATLKGKEHEPGHQVALVSGRCSTCCFPGFFLDKNLIIESGGNEQRNIFGCNANKILLKKY